MRCDYCLSLESHLPLHSDFTFTSTGIDGNASHIQYFQIPLNAEKSLQSITLPLGTVGNGRLHIFSMSLFTSSSLRKASDTQGPDLVFQYVRSRNQWFNDSALAESSLETTSLSFMQSITEKPKDSVIQVIEVAISNLPNNFSTSTWLVGDHTVEIQSSGLTTVYAGTLKRLRAGDQARVKVGVVNKSGTKRGAVVDAVAVVKDSKGKIITTSQSFEIVAGIPEYDTSLESLSQHEAPKWYEDAKVSPPVVLSVYV